MSGQVAQGTLELAGHDARGVSRQVGPGHGLPDGGAKLLSHALIPGESQQTWSETRCGAGNIHKADQEADDRRVE